VPHAPQLVGSFERSWQLAPQQVSLELAHGWVGEHPVAHAFDTQIWPGVQSVSCKHSRHWFCAVSQCGVGALQSLASSQPAWHWPVAESQYWPCGQSPGPVQPPGPPSEPALPATAPEPALPPVVLPALPPVATEPPLPPVPLPALPPVAPTPPEAATPPSPKLTELPPPPHATASTLTPTQTHAPSRRITTSE
jgi:hypothetical protein